VEDVYHLSFLTLAVSNQLHAPDTISLAKNSLMCPEKDFLDPRSDLDTSEYWRICCHWWQLIMIPQLLCL